MIAQSVPTSSSKKISGLHRARDEEGEQVWPESGIEGPGTSCPPTTLEGEVAGLRLGGLRVPSHGPHSRSRKAGRGSDMVRAVAPAEGARAWPGPGSRQASPLRAPSLQARRRARRWLPPRAHQGPAGASGLAGRRALTIVAAAASPHFTRLSLRRTPSLGACAPPPVT